MNRGSITGIYWPARARPSFNEAPIHESGKSAAAKIRDAATEAGFNEAPIHESGK